MPDHEVSGVVVELGYGTTGLSVGQRVFGLTDWTQTAPWPEDCGGGPQPRPLPADIDHTVAAALPISGLTAFQALIDHAHLRTGQTVLVHGAAGGVGSIAVQLAREVGATVIGTGRATDREAALGLAVHTFLDLEADRLEDVGEVDVVLDVIGGEILDRSAALVRLWGGTLVTTIREPTVQPKDGHAIFFVVESDRSLLAGSRPAGQGWGGAEADRRGSTAADRSTCCVRPRPAHPRQDDHSDHRRRIASRRVCHSLPLARQVTTVSVRVFGQAREPWHQTRSAEIHCWRPRAAPHRRVHGCEGARHSP